MINFPPCKVNKYIKTFLKAGLGGMGGFGGLGGLGGLGGAGLAGLDLNNIDPQ